MDRLLSFLLLLLPFCLCFGYVSFKGFLGAESYQDKYHLNCECESWREAVALLDRKLSQPIYRKLSFFLPVGPADIDRIHVLYWSLREFFDWTCLHQFFVVVPTSEILKVRLLIRSLADSTVIVI